MSSISQVIKENVEYAGPRVTQGTDVLTEETLVSV